MTTFYSRATGSKNTAQVRVKTLKEAGLKPGKPKGELTEEDLSHDGLRSFASCPEFKAAHNYWGNEWVVHRAELMTGGGWCMYASANFERLDLGCIKADFCNQIHNFQNYLRSTRFPHFCTAQN